jgi:hypothetical protein
MATRRVANQDGWTLRKAPRARTGGRRGSGEGPEIPQAFLQSDAVNVEEVFEAVPAAGPARRAAPPDLVLEVDMKPGEASLLAIRHPSGALTFHPSTERVARSGRRGGAGSAIAQFRVPVRRVGDDTGRRGLVSKAVKVVVLKIAKAAVDKAVSFALPKLAALWEKRIWSQRNLHEGWFHVTPAGGDTPGLRLARGVPEPRQRTLLLVHGTFSNAASAFGPLAGTGFFERVSPLYGNRIYAYNHFSVSRTPDENARELRNSLPPGEYSFDAITHSRGGLVLRSLVEHHELHGAIEDRIRLGHAVLVASPNEGTPLATPARWENTVGWFANLMEVFPDNPFTTGAEFVSESIVWLASHLAGDLPGLRAMDGAGDLVTDLQSPPGPPPNVYSALVSNFHPDAALWERALDVGVDSFFASANDLVVPSEGGWRIDRDGSPYVPASRIGCFGPGGNIDTTGTSPVNHVSFFGRSETAEFLARALAGEAHKLTAIDPDEPLPDRRFTRSSRSAGARPERAVDTGAAPPPTTAPGTPRADVLQPQEDIDTFHIVVMDEFEPEREERESRRKKKKGPKFAQVFASYGGARVTTTMQLRADKGEPKTLFGEIIDFHQRIKDYTNREKGSLPTDDQMVEFGGHLFETLFQGDVRRLYDEARSRQRGRKLDLVLTSMIPWIAEKPWEFAHDTGRLSFLATEEIHFVRNVLTNIPADPIVKDQGPLRILVASAQPVGFGRLSIDQEVEVIRRGFEPLIEAGLVVVDVLPRATPASIHGHLSTGRYTIVHFIGHGVFDEEKNEGCLVFEDNRGGEFPLGERSVREIFCKRGLSLVFLNACQSGAGGGRADFNKGVAQALVSHGLPALVANQYSVLDSSATSFAQHFYWSLAQGMTLGESAREARIAVNYSLHGELIDWAVPVLYARDANRALCVRPAKMQKVPATTVLRTSRRSTTGRQTRVAVWDIDDVFPALDRTLERMNAAQEVFGFELVDMSVPLDVWDLEAKKGKPYLWAERLAERLQSKTVELRANLLACVTRHWMRDDKRLNLFGWWPENRKPPVVIFSCAGFDKLEAEGPATDRAIANAMVAALAGFFGEIDAHERGAKDCPLFFNQNWDAKHMIGAQRFDPSCRKKLNQKMRAQLPALDALLKVFRLESLPPAAPRPTGPEPPKRTPTKRTTTTRRKTARPEKRVTATTGARSVKRARNPE